MQRGREGRAAGIAADVAAEQHSAIVAECIEQGTAAEVRCVLEAESLDDVSRCTPR